MFHKNLLIGCQGTGLTPFQNGGRAPKLCGKHGNHMQIGQTWTVKGARKWAGRKPGTKGNDSNVDVLYVRLSNAFSCLY